MKSHNQCSNSPSEQNTDPPQSTFSLNSTTSFFRRPLKPKSIATLTFSLFIVCFASLQLLPHFENSGVTTIDQLAATTPTQLSPHFPAEPPTLATYNLETKLTTHSQQALANWIQTHYGVSNASVATLIKAAFSIGNQLDIQPSLILAVAAVESGFNPNAQSSKGAQGLMQVMTRVHYAKYEPFGGVGAAFDPVANLQVGSEILREYIQRTGSVQTALRYYVGAAALQTDGGYANKVLRVQKDLQRAANHGISA